ncbi:transketolase [Mycoplasma enhydrae]|uniref:transketolase n=1 Tax=Mycoplasma enhydrae TaxID=2499220 RepID=UPI00197BD09D|nr:transketolase [Mycoplasma enhydrae]MBN4089509.1 transketolase [Mycoplasma enhydrae]MCV3733646.1 transketolase [Mycoplasma enhydrae]
MFRTKKINEIAIDNIKINALAQIANAKVGNIPINISAAKIFHTLFAFHYKFDFENPQWINRDRFVLSDANAIPTYYSVLYLLGLITKEELQNINKPSCKLAHHLKKNNALGIEVSSGCAGQGIAEAVGFAIAEANLSASFKEISHYTYVFVSSKDLETGLAYEALELAGNLNLNKLIVLYDSNSLLSDSEENKKSNVDIRKKYEALGFKFHRIKGANYKSISSAIGDAKKSKKPNFIEIKTTLGELNLNILENFSVKNKILSFEEIDEFKETLNFKKNDFFDVYSEVVSSYAKVKKRNNNIFKKWTPSDQLLNFLNEELKENINDNFLSSGCDIDTNLFTIMNNIFDKYKNTFALSSTLKTLFKIKSSNGVFANNNQEGRSLLYGPKRMAAALIANAIRLHSNFKPFIINNLLQADLFISGIRKAVDDNLKILYLLDNDINSAKSSKVSYQPEEQISILNSIERLTILYPSNLYELLGAIEYYLNKASGPVVIISNFASSWICENTSKQSFISGAYYVLKNNSEFTLLAKGSDMKLAHKIAEKNNLNLISISNEENLDKLSYNKKFAITFSKDIGEGWMKYARFNLNINNSNNKLKSDFNLVDKTIKSIISKKN